MATSSYWGLSVRPCGSCRTSSAQLSCITCKNFYLCPTCDLGNHSNHLLVPLCEVWEQNPASVSCRADSATLCATCDADIHTANLLANRHVRVPVVQVTGNLSKSQPFFGLNMMFGEEERRDEAEAATWLLAEPTRDGKYEESKEMCGGPQVAVAVASEFDWGLNDVSKGLYSPVYQEASGSGTYYLTHSGSSSETAVVPEAIRGGQDQTHLSANREAKLMRYREKRKSRQFKKTIRYASRKAYAETRPRVNGRFAKRDGAESDQANGIYSSAAAAIAALINDADYGVVPSLHD
ncbi:hypothetical protein LUZ60_017534 [Juncus effusus]|nr:hypothetical protein LUZ60_017534 [Juncus effusus]